LTCPVRTPIPVPNLVRSAPAQVAGYPEGHCIPSGPPPVALPMGAPVDTYLVQITYGSSEGEANRALTSLRLSR